MAAVAVSQMLGFGLLTGTLARWRLLPQIGLTGAAKVTAYASLSFMVSLALLGAVAVLASGADLPWAGPVASMVLIVAGAWILITLWRPRALLRWTLPPLKAQGQILAYSCLDTCAAAVALFVLIPVAHAPDPALFYAAFLLSLAIGLIGTTPGGLGPFEFMMLTCLPISDAQPLLAAILAYRLVYFAIPAAIAFCVLLASPWAQTNTAALAPLRVIPARRTMAPLPAVALSYTAHRAEAGLIRQGEFDLLLSAQGQAQALVASTHNSLILLSGPLAGCQHSGALLSDLEAAADAQCRIPCLYKCDGKLALAARAKGWRVKRIGKEAVLNPQTFDLATRARRQLRRALRKADAAEVHVAESSAPIPFAKLAPVAARWASKRNGGRGFSMGRFDEGYVRAQRIYIASVGDNIVGFASFHECWRERGLDLLCVAPDAPTGVAQSLILGAIDAAREEGVARLSLAAVPQAAELVPQSLRPWVECWTAAPGLLRFKGAFAPRWEPLYMAAPSRLGLALAGFDLVDRITRPRGAC